MDQTTLGLRDSLAERASIVQHSAAEFLAGEWSNPEYRKLIESGDGYDDALWTKMCALGWPSLAVPEEDGGVGATIAEVAVIAEECGRALASSPFIPHVVATELLLSAPAPLRAKLNAAMTEGAEPLTLAVLERDLTSDRANVALTATSDGDAWLLNGEKLFVPAARRASTIVVAAKANGGGTALFAVPRSAPGVDVKPMKTLDWSAVDTVAFKDVRLSGETLIAQGDGAERLLREALLRSDLLIVAELCGLAASALDMAVEYAKIRETFGKPIGQYQAVKHRLVNSRADIEIAKSLVRAATASVAADAAEKQVDVSRAAYWAIDQLKKVPESCIQVFGGIGFTWDHDIHLYLRRSATLSTFLGDRVEHREVIVEALDKQTSGAGERAEAAA